MEHRNMIDRGHGNFRTACQIELNGSNGWAAMSMRISSNTIEIARRRRIRLPKWRLRRSGDGGASLAGTHQKSEIQLPILSRASRAGSTSATFFSTPHEQQQRVAPGRKPRLQTVEGIRQKGPHPIARAIPQDVGGIDQEAGQILGARGGGADVEQEVDEGARVEGAVRQVVRRREAERLARTASTGISTGRARTRRRSSGKASPANGACSLTSSCTARSAALPMCSSATRSRRATASSSTCR